MALLPPNPHSTVALIDAAVERAADREDRPHLGASLIGHPCDLYLWLMFRWAIKRAFSGRMLRLFARGQREEAVFVDLLRRIGVTVSEGPSPGKQWSASALGGHFGCSIDAAALGVPEAPATWHDCEFKTHNAKSFAELARHGVAKAKPMHEVQMQTGMGLLKLTRALYLAVCKDDDQLHAERIHFDKERFAAILARAERIIYSPTPPEGVSRDPSWYECKMCDAREHCHGTTAPQVSCRTCAHSTPMPDGDKRWVCEYHKRDLQLEDQRAACPSHRHFPVLLGRFAELMAVNGNDVTYRNTLTGATFSQPQLSSREITAAQDKTALGAPEIEELRTHFAGELVG